MRSKTAKPIPRYRMANQVVIIAFILSAIFIGVYMLSTAGIGVAWMGFISVLYLLIPFVARKLFRLKPAYLLDIVLYVFIFFAFNIGVALRLYGSVWWYDLVTHGVSGLVFTGIGLCVYYYLRENKELGMGADRRLAVAFSFCFCQFTAAAWEFIEYAGFVFFGHDSQDMANGVKDTMEDMLICMAGSILYCIFMYIHLRGKHKIFLLKPVDEFFRVNYGKKKTEKAAGSES